MWIKRDLLKFHRVFKAFNPTRCSSTAPKSLPESADVVIIGGGSAGCNLLYQLSKRGVDSVLIERGKLTSGTTWHTAGVVWSLRPNDTDIQLLAITQQVLSSLEAETGHNPGWINNGGIFISHSPQRTNEYRRLETLGKCFGVPSQMMTSEEARSIFPLLDAKSYEHALYSPNDGVVDPAMMCTSLARGAIKNGARVFEDHPVEELIVGENFMGDKEVKGVRTKFGSIKANAVVNATGVWGRNLLEPHGISLPLVPMRHAYVVSETIEGVRGMPNVRDHDFSLYFRVQGQAISMGGYEDNPILLHNVPQDFQFTLYDLDYSVFDTHIEGAVKLCPAFGEAGVKSTVCGPESFTPDHKALMGPDPCINNLFHSCGFNSVGMMFGAGCGNQLASWIINGKPDLNMWSYDVRRFTPKQRNNYDWVVERSHEAYAKNYKIVFPNDQPLAGRNFEKDPFHELMLSAGALMEEKAGFERPGLFFNDGGHYEVPKYDWYGSYGNERNKNQAYEKKLDGDYKFEHSDYHKIIADEALACRENAAIFNLSYFCKFYIVGPQATDAVRWIFTANIANKPDNKTTYTCALNSRGGVESDVTITPIEKSSIDPQFNGRGFYGIAGGASGFHTLAHIREGILEKKFNANVVDATHDFGILSIQGRNIRKILSKLVDVDLSNETFPFNSAKLVEIDGIQLRILRVSFVGELGFELHIPRHNCAAIYEKIFEAGREFEVKNAGFRALYSLSSEKGYHLWGHDLRSDDSPLEANLAFTCRQPRDEKDTFKGRDAMLQRGIQKRLIFLTLDEPQKPPLWGLEAVYCDGKIVGHLRRGDYAYTLDTAVGQCYVKVNGGNFEENFLKNGHFQVESMGKVYKAKAHLKSPFDPKGLRILGKY